MCHFLKEIFILWLKSCHKQKYLFSLWSPYSVTRIPVVSPWGLLFTPIPGHFNSRNYFFGKISPRWWKWCVAVVWGRSSYDIGSGRQHWNIFSHIRIVYLFCCCFFLHLWQSFVAHLVRIQFAYYSHYFHIPNMRSQKWEYFTFPLSENIFIFISNSHICMCVLISAA